MTERRGEERWTDGCRRRTSSSLPTSSCILPDIKLCCHLPTHARARAHAHTHARKRTSYVTSLASPDIQIKYRGMKIRHLAGSEMRLDEILTSPTAVILHANLNGTRPSAPGGGGAMARVKRRQDESGVTARSAIGCGEQRDVTRCCPLVAALHRASSALCR